MVALTSIGAGALGTVALFILYPFLPTRRLVGTEIAHAVPLTLVAGLGHASMGNMNWELLGFLSMGSLPGIYIGSHLAGRVPDNILRPLLAFMLFSIGYKLVFEALSVEADQQGVQHTAHGGRCPAGRVDGVQTATGRWTVGKDLHQMSLHQIVLNQACR